ncbi:arabinosyltransferase [Amycolatopsis sp. NBRC 101858]|uniref:arabinosyltransferase domain-containing protein n=1 Tax=Amycolatopsis sp. NBRC 101858 TaxID=3032200 RepID=UPI0024A1E27A|nr:arabinosyltransferase domain-containing protein [Amycolatopsis sp. NBRC 101858]GLY34000.1 arabinosyltransferase [Amycolatopsis sp. NBRC 101858]
MWTVGEKPTAIREPVADRGQARPDTALWRRLVVVLGVLSAACAIAYPLLPVVQDTAEITWPVAGDTRPVNAPLTGYWAQDLRADLPCAAIRALDARKPGGASLFSTVPGARTADGAGVFLRVEKGVLTAFDRGRQVADQPLPATGCDVRFSATATRTTLTVAGTPVYDASGDVRPRVVGIYTDLDSATDPIAGLRVSIVPDTRYQSAPTGLKTGVGLAGVLALIGCLIAVNRLDRGGARRAPRWAPVGWWKLTKRDFTVFGVLGAWVFIGPVTSDDGYILTMARVAEQTGYLTNYHRWFGVAEAPFGWNDHIYELMAAVSTVPTWIRLPSLLIGVLCWLLISREVMPRLGTQVRQSPAASWAAAMVFLVWWLPFNDGVRPEPWAALGSLLALCAVERALVTRRLLPLCLGLLSAAFALAATPTALIAVAPFLVAARPLFQLLRARVREAGWATVLAPIAAAGLIVLVVVFADQTVATVLEATRLRGEVGPSEPWYNEFSRYELLFSDDADGSMTRRFPVLLLVLCTGTCLVVLLRRGRIQGAALGPARRLIGTTALFFLLLALTPTKWTHHFGAFAAVGSAMAALTALATSSAVLRSRRNRAAFTAGLLVVAALAATGPNAYWFVSGIGVPWFDKPPSVHGVPLSTVLLLAAAVTAVIAFVENVQAQRPGLLPPVTQERRLRALKLGSLSLVVVCGLVVAFEFASMGKAIQKQWNGYSLGAANVRQAFTGSGNLSDHVMVEKDPASSALKPVSATTAAVAKRPATPGLPPADQDNGPTSAGFHSTPKSGDDPLDDPPHGFTAGALPMWSSYGSAERTGRLRTGWYRLPDNRADAQIAVSVAAEAGKAEGVRLEFGTNTSEGVKVAKSEQVLATGADQEPGGGPESTGKWADERVQIGDLPKEVTLVRVVAKDDDVTSDGWVAVTAPRFPTFTTLTQRVGDAPVYLDWPAAFGYPRMNPVASHDGISEVPEYRITADPLASEAGWANNVHGGPLGWLEEVADEPEVPSYLQGAPGQPWGQLIHIEPYAEGAAPHVEHGARTVWGWWSPGPGPQQPNGSTATR